MVIGFDVSTTIGLSIEEMMDRNIPLVIYENSRCLYDRLVSISTTTEERLLIDIHMLRKSYERREIYELLWISTDQNTADGFKKEKCTPDLKNSSPRKKFA